MNHQKIIQCGEELYQALIQRNAVRPFTERFDDITIEDAYHISLQWWNVG